MNSKESLSPGWPEKILRIIGSILFCVAGLNAYVSNMEEFTVARSGSGLLLLFAAFLCFALAHFIAYFDMKD